MSSDFDKYWGEIKAESQKQTSTFDTLFDTIAEENVAVEGDAFDKEGFIQTKVERQEDPVLSEPSFFKGYWSWLHQKEEPARVFSGEWLGRVVPDSISKTAVGLAEFPFHAMKSFTDPVLKIAEDSVRVLGGEDKELKPEETMWELGKAAWNITDGLARFFGEPLGLYGWEKFKDKWESDPAGSAFAVAPILKAGTGQVVDAGLSPTEFGTYDTGLKGVMQKVYDKIDVQAPYTRHGAQKTGEMIKNSHAKPNAEQTIYRKVAKTVSKLKIPRESGVEITLQTAKSKHGSVSPSPEIKAASKIYETYFQEAAKRLKKDKVLNQEWPNSYITRNETIIENLVDQYKTTKKGLDAIEKKGLKRASDHAIAEGYRDRLTRVKTEIKDTELVNKELKKTPPQYVHIPLSRWNQKIREVMGETEGQRMINQYHKGRFFHKRTTVDIGDKIEWLKTLKDQKGKPIFEPADFDIRMIGAEYAQMIGKMRGLSDIFNAAKKDGLIIPKTDLPANGYGEATLQMSGRFPELKNHYIHNTFANYLDGHLKNVDRGMELGRVMGYTKMMAFWNPIILPAYDLWQASWLTGSGFTKGLSREVGFGKGMKEGLKQEFGTFPTFRGIRSYFLKNKDAIEFLESGATSTPFTPPFKNFRAEIEGTIYNSLAQKGLEIVGKRAKNPLKLVDDFYKMQWNMAWGGDGAIRMGTWYYLRDLGLTKAEAGQMTAYFHGDYARPRPGARKVLNKVFFTPSFKYGMGHLQANMTKSAVAVMDSALRLKKPSLKNLTYAKGAVMLFGGMMATNKMMEHWGFKTDSFGLRYSKEVDTPEGKREVVVYWPNPNNVILRQVLKWKKWGDDPDKLNEFVNKAKWDLHPLWQLAIDLGRNATGKSTERHVYNPFDAEHPEKIAWDITNYSVKSIVGIVGAIDDHIEDKGAMSAYDALSKEVGWINQKFLSAATLAYLRHTPTVKGAFTINKLNRIFKQFHLEDKPKTPEEARHRLKNYLNRMKEIHKEMDKVKK